MSNQSKPLTVDTDDSLEIGEAINVLFTKYGVLQDIDQYEENYSLISEIIHYIKNRKS